MANGDTYEFGEHCVLLQAESTQETRQRTTAPTCRWYDIVQFVIKLTGQYKGGPSGAGPGVNALRWVMCKLFVSADNMACTKWHRFTAKHTYTVSGKKRPPPVNKML